MSIFKIDNKIILSRLLIAGGLILVVLFSVGLIKELYNRHQVNRQVADLEKQISQLQQENGQLSSLVDSWDNGQYLEKEARIKLGLQRPGEKAFLIVNKNSPGADQSGNNFIKPDQEIVGKVIMSQKIISNDQSPNPLKWWHYFFK
ncbi:MAG: septum formation initiator family protein [Patescibacteria group bacterium]